MNLERLKSTFLEGFQAGGTEIGASVSVWHQGKELMTLHEGFTSKTKKNSWDQTTLIPVFSATKGPAAATLALSLEEAGMTLDSEVRRVWKRFPVPHATFGEMISHQCGLCAIEEQLQATDQKAILSAIEAQTPLWEPMSAHGYHPRLAGYMQDHCVQLLTGRPLGDIWRSEIAEPLEIDFWIGLPPEENHRVATLYAGKMQPNQHLSDFYNKVGTAGTIPNRAFRSPKGVQGASEMNRSENWSMGYPAMGGVGTAQGLAKFYQATMGFLPRSPFTKELRAQFNRRLTNGEDLVLCAPTAFGGGFMMDPLDEKGRKVRNLIGSDSTGYGHPGAGGSHAYADPSTGYSFAYVMNQMEVSVLPGERVKSMLQSL